MNLAAKLIGTWYFAKDNEPDGRAFFHFSDDGRYVQFVLNPENPEERLPMRLWYSVESLDRIRLRPRRVEEGWTRHCEFRNETLVLSSEDRHWICTRAEPHEIPVWFRKALANFKAESSWRPFKWKD